MHPCVKNVLPSMYEKHGIVSNCNLYIGLLYDYKKTMRNKHKSNLINSHHTKIGNRAKRQANKAVHYHSNLRDPFSPGSTEQDDSAISLVAIATTALANGSSISITTCSRKTPAASLINFNRLLNPTSTLQLTRKCKQDHKLLHLCFNCPELQ
ncbi:hypothetical protein Droror1_Dr00012467 [Drosera rotundifolia]